MVKVLRRYIYFNYFKNKANRPMHIYRFIGDKISDLDGFATRRYLSPFMKNSDIYFFRLSSFDIQAQIALFKKIMLIKETSQEARPEEYNY